MNVFHLFTEHVRSAVMSLAKAGVFPAPPDLTRIVVEPPREASHGDLATNAAMALAKDAGLKPRDLAEKIAAELGKFPEVTRTEIAGPGFINLTLDPTVWRAALADIVRAGSDYGRSPIGAGKPVNVEYVSANPTGPMHVGHCRGAVFGDALANLLAVAGFAVTREYYINDAGGQVDVLARSAFLRYREALGENIGAIPEGLYPGDYLKPVGATIETLRANGQVYEGRLPPPKGAPVEDYEDREQTLFRATAFGDDVDRPLKKSDGSYTYFASDIAYHKSKFDRGFRDMIDVWGADHGGYVKRMRAAVKAISGDTADLDVKIVQLVKLMRAGVEVKMSKRSGEFVTLREVVDEVGRDAVRFMMLYRKNDAALDFDLAKVIEQSKDNPVFYVQYGHARGQSVFRNAAEALPDLPADAEARTAYLSQAPLDRLDDPAELSLMRKLALYPRLVESAALAHEPHRVAFYLYELASEFHAQWSRGTGAPHLRFIILHDPQLTVARLALVQGFVTVLASGLALLGVEAPNEMR
jgi:arginyl-tRNA synthetase